MKGCFDELIQPFIVYNNVIKKSKIMNRYELYDKIKNTILSCKTTSQLESCLSLIENTKKEDVTLFHTLTRIYNEHGKSLQQEQDEFVKEVNNMNVIFEEVVNNEKK